MRILVTGSHGYIGTAVINELKTSHPLADLVQVDLVTGNRFEQINDERFDVVIHLAASTSVEQSEILKSLYIQNNIANTIKLFASNKFDRIVFASTNSVFNIDGVIEPSSVYGATKLVGENYLLDEFAEKAAILRIANPIGLRKYHGPILSHIDSDTASVLHKLALCKLNNEVFLIHNLPGMVRDFIELDVVSKILVDLATNKNQLTGLFQLGSGVGTNVVELLTSLCMEFGISHDYIDPPHGVDLGYLMDSTNAHKIWGLDRIECNFSEILKQYIDVLTQYNDNENSKEYN